MLLHKKTIDDVLEQLRRISQSILERSKALEVIELTLNHGCPQQKAKGF
jgi:hypothetical protein